jgi:hypothetical protein
MAAILAPGGIFACSSAFYSCTNVESTLRFSRLWIRRAVQWLRKTHPEVQLSREAKAIAMQWLTSEEYSSLLKESGFSHYEHRDEQERPAFSYLCEGCAQKKLVEWLQCAGSPDYVQLGY